MTLAHLAPVATRIGPGGGIFQVIGCHSSKGFFSELDEAEGPSVRDLGPHSLGEYLACIYEQWKDTPDQGSLEIDSDSLLVRVAELCFHCASAVPGTSHADVCPGQGLASCHGRRRRQRERPSPATDLRDWLFSRGFEEFSPAFKQGYSLAELRKLSLEGLQDRVQTRLRQR